MSKYKKKIYLFLLFIVLVSCDGRGCIEADDFGEWDKVSFKVLSRNDICGIDTTGGSLVGDERVEICLGVGRSTDATKRISGGTKFSSLSRERCDLTISKDSTYNDIFNILSLSEDERRAKYTTDVSFSDNCGSSPIARTKILQEFFDNGLAECITECNANDTADTTYNYDRYEPGWRMMDVGNIKIGEGQSMDIRVKGKITLQPLMEKKYSFDAKENGLQISDLYLDSGVLFSVTTNVSDSEDFPYEDVKKRINSLRRAVVYVKNLPHNAVVDYLGNYYGPSLSFDSIKDNYISCVNGYCAVSCNTNCGMQKTTNESYYSFSDATSIDIVGQVVVPDNYNFITSQPFKTDGTIDDSKNAVPKAYTLNSDEPKVFKSEYPYKIMYNAPIGCSLNVDGNNNSLSTNKDWSFIMDGNTHKIYNYDSIKSSSSAKSVSFSRNGCTGNIKVLFVPLNFVKFQTSGFVEFKNFSSGTSSAQFSYKILNPEVIGVAGKESHIEETSSKIDVSSSAWTKSVSGKLIYVRKGQVMLFEESNWFFEGSNGSTPNGTLIEKPNDFRNLVITVTPRPALLCKGFAEEKFDNPSCKKMADPSGEFYCKKEYEEICKGDRNDGSCLLSDGKYDEDCDKPDMCNSGGGKYEKCNGLNIPPDSPKTIKEGNFSSKRRGANIMVCPGGCYKKQVDGEAMEGENWSDIFSEKEVNYQIYFVDVKEKEMNDITRQNLCPYPLRDDGGNLIYSYNDEGKPAPNIVLESCEICSKNVLNIEPEISVPGIVQCYDLENYIGKVSSFDPKTVGTDDAMGAVKIGNINGRTGNYFSLESLVLDSSKKDINGAYTEFLYTSGTTALPVSSLSSIQFLSLRHDDNFDFSSETESSVSGDYTLSYSVAKAFDGGEQMAIVVADKDWDRKSNAYQHIIKYNLDKSNSAGYGDFINDTGYKIVNGRLVSDNGQLQYVFDSVLFNDLSGFKYENLRLFFKIIDKKYASESTCRNDQEVYADVTYYKCPNTDFSEEYPSTAVDGVYVKGCGFEATTKLYSLVKDPVGGNGVAFCSTVNGYNVEYGKDNKCHYTLPDSDTSKTKTKDKAFLYEPRKELKTVRPTWIIDLSGKESSNGSARCPASYSYEGVTYTNSDINNVPSVSGVNVTCNYNTPRCVDKGDMRCDSSCHTNSEFCYRRSICPDKGGSYKDVESEVDSASKIDYIYGKIPETNRMFKEDYCYYLERTCPSFEIDPNTKDIGTCVDHGTQWLRKSGRSTYNKSVSVDREVLYEDRTVLKPRAKELLDLREIGGDGLVVTVANAENASGFSGSGNLILRYESGGKDVEDCSAVHSDYEHSHKYYDESTDKYYCIFLKKTAKCPTTYKFNNVTYTNTNNGGIPNSSKDSGIICNYVQTTCPDDGNNVCNDLCHTNNQFCYSKPCDTSTKTGNNNTSYVYVAGNNANNNAIISYIYGKIPTGNRMAKDSYCYYIEESCPNFDLLNSGDSVYTTCSISANSQKWVRTAAVVDSSIDYNKPIEVQTRVGNGGVCYDMYKENIGDYFVTLKAQRNFRERSSGSNAELLDTNKMTYMTSSASGLIIKYIILPTLEAFEGKNMQIMTTVGSTDTNLQYVRCGDGNPARDDCVKFRGGGWRIGCTGGDNLCYEITTGVNAAAPQLVPCTDDTVGLTGQCAIFTGDNSYGPVCKSGDANCVNLCQSNVFTNACGVYTSVMDNDSMALDDTFGLKCNDSGDPGCYRDCSKLNSEQKYAQCRVVNNNGGFVKRFYIKTITSSFYQTILKNLLVIMFTFYGLLSLAGMTKINNKELMNITVKIGIIYLFVGSSGWFYYEKFVVRFFTDGVTWMTYALTSAFDQTGDVALAFKANDFTDRSILFSSFEKNISLLFSAETTYKVFGLLFVSFFGWLYVMLIYSAFVTYVFASITIIVEYICAQLMITILLGFGPVFLCFLLFNKTKKMFDKWINNILGIALEQILTITALSFFNIVFYMSIKAALSYRVCYKPVWTMSLPLFGSVHLMSFWRATSAKSAVAAGNAVPGLFRILSIYIVVDLMSGLIATAGNLAKTFTGGALSVGGSKGALADGVTGVIGKGQQVLRGAFEAKATGAISSFAERTIGYKTDKQEEEHEKDLKKMRQGMREAKEAGETARDEFLADVATNGFEVEGEGKIYNLSDKRVLAMAKQKQENASLGKLEGLASTYNNIREYEGQEAITDKGEAAKQLSKKRAGEFTSSKDGLVSYGFNRMWNSFGSDGKSEDSADKTGRGNLSRLLPLSTVQKAMRAGQKKEEEIANARKKAGLETGETRLPSMQDVKRGLKSAQQDAERTDNKKKSIKKMLGNVKKEQESRRKFVSMEEQNKKDREELQKKEEEEIAKETERVQNHDMAGLSNPDGKLLDTPEMAKLRKDIEDREKEMRKLAEGSEYLRAKYYNRESKEESEEESKGDKVKRNRWGDAINENEAFSEEEVERMGEALDDYTLNRHEAQDKFLQDHLLNGQVFDRHSIEEINLLGGVDTVDASDLDYYESLSSADQSEFLQINKKHIESEVEKILNE